jgi:putative hydrolase of the HAD superfamily
MPSIQVVLFDLGGTLLHYETPPDNTFEQINRRAISAFLATAAGAGTKIPDAELAVRAVSRMAAAMAAKANRTQHASTCEDVIREGLEAVGVKLTSKVWNVAMVSYYAEVTQVVTPVRPETVSVLERLVSDGRSLGLVSNTMWSPEMHDGHLAKYGMLDLIPVRLYSSAVGVVKPHSSIYRQALDRLDVAPAEAVFVGDKLRVDIAGPQKIGMRAVLLASPFRRENDPEITPDARIDALTELPALLEAWDRAIERQVPPLR